MKVYKTDWKTPDLNKSISKSMYIKWMNVLWY
jgi:hypothetical protein